LVSVGAQHAPPLPILMTFPPAPSAHRPDVECGTAARGRGSCGPSSTASWPGLDLPTPSSGCRGAGGPRGRGPRAGIPMSLGAPRRRGRHRVQRRRGRCRRTGQRRPPPASPPIPRAPIAARQLPRSPDPVLVSTTRGARAPGAMASAAVLEYDESLIVPYPRKSLAQGALDPWTKPRYEGRRRILRETARAKGIPLDAPWTDLSGKARHFLLTAPAGDSSACSRSSSRLEVKRYKAVHPRVLAAVPAGESLPRLRRRAAQARSVGDPCGRPDDRGRRRAPGRCSA